LITLSLEKFVMRASLLAVATLSIVLTACSSTPIATSEAPTATAATPAASSSPDVTSKSATAAQALPAHLDPNSLISKQKSVYFDFDVFTIKNEFTAMIERHATYLKAHPELEVKLEGNADERGGREYNLALGQKRSESVKRALVTLGAGEKQLEAVSFGEEKPKMTGHDETSWAENRRVDFVYATKK
jgi:peptidoglycan-associated lipoprotein